LLATIADTEGENSWMGMGLDVGKAVTTTTRVALQMVNAFWPRTHHGGTK